MDHLLTPNISYVLTDAEGRILSEREPARAYYAASTIKLGVALAVGRAVESGSLDLASRFPATRTFLGTGGKPLTLAGDHLDPEFPADGVPVDVAALCRTMVSRSSNEATNILLQAVGLEPVAAVFRDLGLRSTRVDRLIGDSTAAEAGLTNETSAQDLVALLRATVLGKTGGGQHLPPRVRQLCVSALEAQATPPIGRALPPGLRWGSKSGEVPGYRHDVAFIGDPESPSCRYLAVCTQGFEEAQADEAMATIVRALGLDGTHG